MERAEFVDDWSAEADADSESTRARRYGWKSDKNRALTRRRKAGMYESGRSAGNTTTNTNPSPFSTVQRTLNPSRSIPSSSALPAALFSIMISLMSKLIGELGAVARVRKVGEKDFDHRTIPEACEMETWSSMMRVERVGSATMGEWRMTEKADNDDHCNSRGRA